MANPMHDFVHAARTLTKARAFTAVCVVSLGLGMSVIIGIMLLTRMVFSTPPGVKDDRLAEIIIRPTGALLAQAGTALVDTWSYPDYLDVRGGASGMVLTGWSPGEGLFRPADRSAAVRLSTMYVSSDYFATLGVTLPRGSGFSAGDDASSAPPEAVISHRMWQVRLAGDQNIIGKPITVNQTEYVVVGVAPDDFRGHTGGLNGEHYQLWLPLSRHPRLTATGSVRFTRDSAFVRMLTRLPEGMSLAQADAMVRSITVSLAALHPATNQDKVGGVEPYFPAGARLRTQISNARLTMFGLAGIVLLVVGLNISGMMLVRSAMRERELAVRMAIGASRWRLMQYHLSEALVLAVLGGSFASGLLFGVPVLVAWWFNYSGPALALFTPDAWLALQCIALCFVTSAVLGLLPAVRFSRPAILSALKNDSTGSGRRVGRLQRLTAAAQAGIAVPFLVIGGIKLDQARVTAMADHGFNPQGLYATKLSLSAVGRTDEDRRLFLSRLQETLAQAPGVRSVAIADGLPLDAVYRNTRVARDGESTFVDAHTTRIGPGYLDALEIRMLAGRAIEANDRDATEKVVVLSEPLAQQLFPAGDPLGRRVTFALAGNERQTHTVVGVSADLVSTQMGNPRPQLFVSLAQHPAPAVFAIARSATADEAMRRAFDDAIKDASPELALGELVTGEGLVENSTFDLLTHSAVGGVAAGVALILAALGVYGVIAFMVATRTREIGVRVALGASRARVLGDVLGDALKLVVPGIGAGLVLAVLWVRLADPSWYPLGGVEPLIYSVAAAVAFAVAALAGIPSARRAAAIQPIVAMRTD
ncbi:MAG TPA: ABC transporter permease [Vicinamibacterales bacterium]|nr:ABC transporter permease [Vicinamibacterales bacterium]